MKHAHTDTLQAKNKGIPPGARWTRIDRKLVNPESLEEAKERFEERADCVIVLRVLTKEEIQKFADRTNIIRGRPGRSPSVDACDARYREYPRRRRSSSMSDGRHYHHNGREYRSSGSRSAPRRHSYHPSSSPPATTKAMLIDLVAAAFPNLIPRILADDLRAPTEKRETERRGELEERESRHSASASTAAAGASSSKRNRERRERDEYEEENSEDEFKSRAPKMLEAPSTGGASGGGDVADFRDRREGRERERERERDREGSYVSGPSVSSSGKRRDEEYERER